MVIRFVCFVVCTFSFGVFGGAYSPSDQLALAVRNNDLIQVERLLAQGVRPDDAVIRFPNDIVAPVIVWAANEAVRLPVLAKLVLAEADVNLRLHGGPNHGAGALHFAAKNGLIPATEVLLSKGAPIDATSGDGFQAIHIAASRGHAELVKFLVRQGASVNARTRLGVTPLMTAAQSGQVYVINELLILGADPNLKSETPGEMHGATALMWATFGGRVQAAKALAAVSDLRAQATNGDSALAIAYKRSRETIASYLWGLVRDSISRAVDYGEALKALERVEQGAVGNKVDDGGKGERAKPMDAAPLQQPLHQPPPPTNPHAAEAVDDSLMQQIYAAE